MKTTSIPIVSCLLFLQIFPYFSDNHFKSIDKENCISLLGKDSIEPSSYAPVTEFYYDIYLKNQTLDYFVERYISPGMDLFSTVKEYFNYIIKNFDISQVKTWWKVDFEKSAMIIYSSIGRLVDYTNYYKPQIGVVMLIYRPDTAHFDLILKKISSQ